VNLKTTVHIKSDAGRLPVYYLRSGEDGNPTIAGYRQGLIEWKFDDGLGWETGAPEVQWGKKRWPGDEDGWYQPRKLIQLSDIDPDFAMVAQIAHLIADNPGATRKGRGYREIGRRTKSELVSIAFELGYEALWKYPKDSNTFERIHGYVKYYLPKACREYERRDRPPGEGFISSDFMEQEIDLAFFDYFTRPVDIEQAKRTWRRATRTGMRPHPHYGKRHRWQLESPAIERKVERMTLVKVFGETSLNDMVVFAVAGLDGNQRDAAARLGVSQQRFSEEYRAARERFYGRYFDPAGTGERTPKLAR
jgi:hypothetical protein